MCDVELTPEAVEIDPSPWEHAGGLQGKFEVPFASIDTVSTSDDPVSLVRGAKTGVGLPKTKIGTWRHDGGEDYYCIRDNDPAVVLHLKPQQKFAQVVLSVGDPTGLANQVWAMRQTPTNSEVLGAGHNTWCGCTALLACRE